MLNRHITLDIQAGLKQMPIVLINGARQVGKSTLANKLEQAVEGSTINITLDNLSQLSAAHAAPFTFIEGLTQLYSLILLDEVQRAPELFLPIKEMVDENKELRFLLTGSANVLTLPKLADSLAGRMEIHTLWPLSQGEILGVKEQFVDRCFDKKPFFNTTPLRWDELMEKIILGGYPKVITEADPRRRHFWFESYLNSLLMRDVRDLMNIEGYKELPNLLKLLSARAGGLLNQSDLSRLSSINMTTLKRYIALLEALFIFVPLPAWFNNEEKRLVKSPKAYLNDTGLLCHLRGINQERLIEDRHLASSVLENYIVMELRKQMAWSNTLPKLYHFRTAAGQEVDILLQAPDGRVVGIEIKSSNEVTKKDFHGLETLAKIATDQFHLGIVLYSGKDIIKFGENLVALPINTLWQP